METAQENLTDSGPLPLEKKTDGPGVLTQPGADPGFARNVSEVDPKENEKHPGNESHALQKSEKVDSTVDVKNGEREEEPLAPEVDSVQVPLHWHAKPCVHVTSIGGQVTEEELLPLFGEYGEISSVSFENERHDAAVIRYENYSGNAEELLAKVRQALNSTKLGDRTLIVEPFRPDSLLFIGNLTLDIDDALLCKMFEPHGKIERAFVLRNPEGRSKGYGFVEYSLKSQATAAKMTMGNINMDGRVLRVEWSDCRKVADMFSSVLFIDRLPRESFHIEQSLRNLFGKFGKVRDCHVAIGINQQYRGFAFIDFAHSINADKAHQALDGHDLDGSNIRVSFSNPSKSAQSYKFRYGSEAAQAALGLIGKGALAVPGMLMGSSLKGPSAMPLIPSRFMSPARPGMLGMGIGMQFGRGSMDRGPLLSSGAGMLGPGSGMVGRAPLLLGNMASRAGMAVGGNLLQMGATRLPTGQGAVSITPSAIAQVATAQAKAREEEAKARAEAGKQGLVKPAIAEQQSMDQYQRYQQVSHQSYYQQQPAAGSDQLYKQSDSLYPYQQSYQQQTTPQQTTPQSQYQSWNQQQQQQQPGQQALQTYSSQYYSQPAQNYTQQQQQTTQYSQNDGYYQQSNQQAQQYGYAQQYGQQQYGQLTSPNYGQTAQTIVQQTTGQQYQQPIQQLQTPYTQQNYSEQYVQQQQPQEQDQTGATATAATSVGAPVQDSSQQQAYAAYYQQQAQSSVPQVGTAAATSTTPTTQQSYEAQWAAYYANQAAYQQANYGQQQSYGGTTVAAATYPEQASTTDVGQKRTADQMESASQNQVSYNYAQASGYPQQGQISYQQQQPANATTAYQQHGTSTVSGYQQPGTALPVASGAGVSYQQPAASGSSGYDQSVPSVADGYQQQTAAAPGTFQVGAQGQTAVSGMYDYSKRPRY